MAARCCIWPSAPRRLLSALLAAGGLSGFGLAARLAWPRRRSLSAGGVRRVGRADGVQLRHFRRARWNRSALFAIGTALIGFGAGLFGHCTLTAAMGTARPGQIGLALGVWGAVQASAAGSAVAAGGLIRDGVGHARGNGHARPGAGRPGDRLLVRLPHRNRVAVRHADRHRPTGAAADAPMRAAQSRASFRPRSRCLPTRSACRGDVMGTGAITSYIDVAQVALYTFWVFFAGLIFYLRTRGQARGLSAGRRTAPTRQANGLPARAAAEDLPAARTARIVTRRAPRIRTAGRSTPTPVAPGRARRASRSATRMLSGVGPAALRAARRQARPDQAQRPDPHGAAARRNRPLLR